MVVSRCMDLSYGARLQAGPRPECIRQERAGKSEQARAGRQERAGKHEEMSDDGG